MSCPRISLPDIPTRSLASPVKPCPSPASVRHPRILQSNAPSSLPATLALPIPPDYSLERREAVEYACRQRRQLIVKQVKVPEEQMRQAVSGRPGTIHHLGLAL